MFFGRFSGQATTVSADPVPKLQSQREMIFFLALHFQSKQTPKASVLVNDDRSVLGECNPESL